MSSGGRPPIDFADWMRDQQRRNSAQERRPMVTTASDLMGPGLAPQAVMLNDWNDDTITFNGFYYSTPGAANTPDSTKAWIGYSIADANGSGIQRITLYPGLTVPSTMFTGWPAVSYSRAFTSQAGTLRLYSVWAPDRPGAQVFDGTDVSVTTTGTTDLVTIPIAVSTASERWTVNVSLDAAHVGTATTAFLSVDLMTGGTVVYTGIFDGSGINGLRVPLSFTYMVTGLSPGIVNIKIRASNSAAGDSYLIRSSLMSVERTI